MKPEMIVFITAITTALAVYFLNYFRFRRLIVRQTKQMINLMKSEEIENLKIGDIYLKTDEDFSELERAALSLRKKYLRLRRLSQEERKGYETVFSGLKEGIVTVDQNLRVLSFNSSFMSFFKWAPTKEPTGYFLQDIIRDPQIIKAFKSTFETRSVNKCDVSQFQLFVTPLPSRNENEDWSMGVFYDLSEIRKTEKIRVDFVANASHELRTPVTVIKGYVDLLKEKLEKTQSLAELELLNPIRQSTDHMSDLLNELLNLSKLDVGAGFVKQQIYTEQITEETMREIESLLNLSQKKIKIHYGASEVMAHPDSLKQVLRNLLINAIKYSGDADLIIINWKCEISSVLLCVKDNGPGISYEHQERIFERFYRVDKGRSRDAGGYGLGLALVKHHMLNHGGNVKVQSELNKGSEFICEFPS